MFLHTENTYVTLTYLQEHKGPEKRGGGGVHYYYYIVIIIISILYSLKIIPPPADPNRTKLYHLNDSQPVIKYIHIYIYMYMCDVNG